MTTKEKLLWAAIVIVLGGVGYAAYHYLTQGNGEAQQAAEVQPPPAPPEAEPANELYRGLLADPGRRRAMGEAARQRVLEEHTYRHRARTLLAYVGQSGHA